MLVLSRRVGEQLVIAGDIVLTVIEVRGDGVRIGIDAPKSIRVHRAEVLDAVRSANAEAAAADEGTEAALRRLLAGGAAPAAGTRADGGAAPAAGTRADARGETGAEARGETGADTPDETGTDAPDETGTDAPDETGARPGEPA